MAGLASQPLILLYKTACVAVYCDARELGRTGLAATELYKNGTDFNVKLLEGDSKG